MGGVAQHGLSLLGLYKQRMQLLLEIIMTASPRLALSFCAFKSVKFVPVLPFRTCQKYNSLLSTKSLIINRYLVYWCRGPTRPVACDPCFKPVHTRQIMSSPTSNPARTPKKLIVCCDGTWQNSDNGFVKGTIIPWNPYGELQIPSNVTRIARAIKPFDDRDGPYQNTEQIVYYQSGIGSTGNLVDHFVGGGTGNEMGEHIREAYAFLANNYADGDYVFLVGFSRGAYVARSVAGLIGDMGLLTKEGIPHFYDVFHDWEFSGYSGYKSYLAKRAPDQFHFERVEGEKFDFARYREELRRLNWNAQKPVEITALAVFDTVGALGIPVNPILQKLNLPAFIHKYRFYDTKLSNHIQNAFQALGLDEHRAPFSPSVWEKPEGCPTNVVQTWFPGVHSNIGGSYADTSIADLTLAWMMSHLDPFLAFYDAYVPRQHAQNAKFAAKAAAQYEAHAAATAPKATALPIPWASGTLYDSYSGLVNHVNGATTRTPGRYTETDPLTSKPTTTPLQGTNERVHASVRVRKAEGGLDNKGNWAEYAPAAMEGWRLDEGQGRARWVYEGSDAKFRGVVMEEDEVGVFEKALIPDNV